MVLIAATAVALVPMRYAYTAVGLIRESPPRPTLEWLVLLSLESYWILVPLLVAWSLALWALRLRKPRPEFRRLFRQPGMAATTAILLTVLLLLVKIVGMFGVAFLVDPNEFATSGVWLFVDVIATDTKQHRSALCDTVLAVWLVLWLARVWRSEASWIDRAGRALGIFGVVYGFLASWISFMG
jgi:hypothetical protein